MATVKPEIYFMFWQIVHTPPPPLSILSDGTAFAMRGRGLASPYAVGARSELLPVSFRQGGATAVAENSVIDLIMWGDLM